MMTPDQIIDMDCRNVARHELGHALLAQRYTYSLRLNTILRAELKSIDALKERCCVGNVALDLKSLTSTQRSEVSWGGIIAERISVDANVDLLEILNEVRFATNFLSPTDIKGIEAVAPRWQQRTARTAFEFIMRHRDTLLAQAMQLAETTKSEGSAYWHWNRAGGWIF